MRAAEKTFFAIDNIGDVEKELEDGVMKGVVVIGIKLTLTMLVTRARVKLNLYQIRWATALDVA